MRGIQTITLLAAAAGVANALPKPDAIAFTLNVSSTPKAETIPYQYGLMFEVSTIMRQDLESSY